MEWMQLDERQTSITVRKRSCDIMGSLQKLALILWKNFIFRRRSYIVTTLEILLPTLFSLLLLVIRLNGGDQFEVNYVNTPTTYPIENILIFNNNGRYNVKTTYTLLYTPESAGQFMMEVASLMNNTESGTMRFNLQLKGVKNEEDIETLSADAYKNHDRLFLGGVVFTNTFDTGSKTLPSQRAYSLRIRNDQTFSCDGGTWKTDYTQPPLPLPGPNDCTGSDYIRTKFLALQHAIGMNFIARASGANVSQLVEEIEMSTEKFPYPPYYQDNSFSKVIQGFLPFFITLSYVFISPTLIKRIVVEKEAGSKELMKLMGLSGWIQWLGWFLTSCIMMTISAAIIVCLLCISFASGTPPVLSRTDGLLFFMILVLYIAASIFFCFFISVFFTKPTLATAVGVLVWLLSYIVPYQLMVPIYDDMNLAQKMSICLFPNMAMAWVIRLISVFEGTERGLQWSEINVPAYNEDTLTTLHIIIMLFVDIVIYGALTWYVDNVYPGIYGVPKPLHFLFTKSYWCKQSVNQGDIEMNPFDETQSDFEKDPSGLNPAIIIRNLVKTYNTNSDSPRAVDNISLNLYEGQITALLGHNGAGKTTTMSVLTGMYAPTSGTAFINGHDIRTDIEAAREDLSLCPQHNLLFDILTVKEHLLFFGKLKGLRGSKLQNSADKLIDQLQLGPKRNELARSLSGGMKRKLSLGISLIGGSKIVMLDEPTSGLDPEARRKIWDLLQAYRPGRCIMLTTHFMEEADVLGDRIAIMNHGRIQCCGSPIFLKRKYGAGYHLNISKGPEFHLNNTLSLIHHYIPNAYLASNISAEISFILPSQDTQAFPDMFEKLEKKTEDLGINSFGVSVTTMEEVFLKVGELADNEESDGMKTDENVKRQLLHAGINNGRMSSSQEPIVSADHDMPNNTGYRLTWQQFYGLLVKRCNYTRRRLLLIVAQVVIPVAMVAIALYLNNTLDEQIDKEKPLTLGLSSYGRIYGFYTVNQTQNTMSQFYPEAFPPGTTVHLETNATKFLINLGTNDFPTYRTKFPIGAEFNERSKTQINAMYNGLFLHTLPISVGVAHNALLKHYTNGSTDSISVTNAPLPKNPDDNNGLAAGLNLMKSLMMGMFIPIGLSFLSSSFVVFPIHERTSKSKHLQLLTGVGGALFWGTSFLWDFIVYIVCICCIMIVFVTMDKTETFVGGGKPGVVFLLLLLYGWNSIPFSYLVSFVAKLPATGFTKLTVLNLIAGIILSMMIFIFQMTEGVLLHVADSLRWVFRLLPNFTVTMAFMNIPLKAMGKSMCPKVPVCPPSPATCCSDANYLDWSRPAIGQEVMCLVLVGALYFVLLYLIEAGYVQYFWYAVKTCCSPKVTAVAALNSTEIMDNDVSAEKYRIANLIGDGLRSDDSLLVHDLTKQFWSLKAVDHLSFGVNNGEVFGLLGVNGAGKTTTFRMLTGDEIMTTGNAYMLGHNIKGDRTAFLKLIGYCPQFDALIDLITGREMLYLFARLRGIPEKKIPTEVKSLMDLVDLSEHADKLTMKYSGGNKRKLSAAIALIGNPPMVMLDEPTTGVDPVARRKFWQILSTVSNQGTSIILTSHSMEECEALCSRLAIMVNGQFKCIGGIQHLKSKFGQGFTIIAKLGSYPTWEQQEDVQTKLQDFMEKQFPGCALKDAHQGMVHYHIMDTTTKWRHLFGAMEDAKQRFQLEDYSVGQTSLEQVFLSFAQMQRQEQDKKKVN